MSDVRDDAAPPPTDPALSTTSVSVQNADTVNVPGDALVHPAVIWLIAFVTIGVLIGFGVVTWAVLNGEIGRGVDAATKGSVIQTWNNMAVAAAAVWTASSVIAKLKGQAK